MPLSPFNNPLVIVPKAPITIGTTVTFMFNSFSIILQGRSTYPSFQILSVLFCGQLGHQSRQFCIFTFFMMSGLLAEIRWSVCMSKYHVSLCVSLPRTGAGLCTYHLFVIIIIIGGFLISASWWSFTGVWVTASLLKSSGLFSVFSPFSVMFLFEWSSIVRQIPSPPVPFIILNYCTKSTNHNWYDYQLQFP